MLPLAAAIALEKSAPVRLVTRRKAAPVADASAYVKLRGILGV